MTDRPTRDTTRLAFLCRNAVRYGIEVSSPLTYTFDMHLFRLPQFPTVLALSNRAAFLLDFE